jgi:hypothetical protein
VRYVQAVESGAVMRHVALVDESGELALCRKRLFDFLVSHRTYDAAAVLPAFPANDLYEERLVVLRRLGRVRVPSLPRRA